MNDAIELLMQEHRAIEKVLDALDVFANAVAETTDYDAADLAKFARFFRDYADGHHHAKEEEILFKAMTDHGFPREVGPIAVMLHEHNVGREFVAALAEAAAVPPPWTSEVRERIHSAADGLSQLLRHHIQKEDGVLYPMALSRLPKTIAELISLRFTERQQDAAETGFLAKLDALAASLTLRYTR